MRPGARPTAGGSLLRAGILVLLALAPPLAGAVHEPVFVPLLCGCALAGFWALLRARGAARRGARIEPLPGARLLVALHALVLVQLVPLPMGVLRLVSPGSHAHYEHVLLDPSGAWRPISVSPPDTLRGLAFLAAFSLLFLAVHRELAHDPWRRRLVATVVLVGVAMTVVAFLQAISPHPRRLYGIWQPRWDWAVFGPYVNRSHLGGYLLMSLALAAGFSMEAFSRVRAAWPRRGVLVLGDPEGNTAIRAAAAVVVLAAGLVAAGARAPIAALFATALVLPLAAGRFRRAALLALGAGAVGIAWIGLGGFFSAMRARGIKGSRLDLWTDMLPMVPRFPLFGVGLDAFSTAYPAYQTVSKVGPDWVGEAHNEYLQVLLDTGCIGACLFALLLLFVFRRALGRAGANALDLGVLGALLGLAIANLVDFNWQIPANAATWVALAALACRTSHHAADAPARAPRSP